jgi:hypothetical protein
MDLEVVEHTGKRFEVSSSAGWWSAHWLGCSMSVVIVAMTRY